MSEETKVVTTEKQALINMGKYGVVLSTMEDAYRFAKAVALSGFAPKGLEKPESIMIAVQHGAEIGLLPMQALQSIAIINGRPGIFGDAALALVRASGLMESYSQNEIGTKGKDDYGWEVTSKRKGSALLSSSFTVEEAKKAGLWGTNVWAKYPDRMLLFRARGFNLRDNFGDVLKGLRTVEELRDIQPEESDIVTTAEPVKEKKKGVAAVMEKVNEKPAPAVDSTGLTDAEKAAIEAGEAAQGELIK
jgi:hypothetical protein